MPFRRHAFTETVVINGVEKLRASHRLLRRKQSLVIWAPDWPAKDAIQPIPREKIVPADLSDWERYRPVRDTVAVDPVLGTDFIPAQTATKERRERFLIIMVLVRIWEVESMPEHCPTLGTQDISG